MMRDGDAVSGVEQRVHLPRDWHQLPPCERLILSRRFHRPTGLGASTRVLLAMPATWSPQSVRLNGGDLTELSSSGDLRRFDLSAPIRQRESHDLEIVWNSLLMGNDIPWYVGLEIHESE